LVNNLRSRGLGDINIAKNFRIVDSHVRFAIAPDGTLWIHNLFLVTQDWFSTIMIESALRLEGSNEVEVQRVLHKLPRRSSPGWITPGYDERTKTAAIMNRRRTLFQKGVRDWLMGFQNTKLSQLR